MAKIAELEAHHDTYADLDFKIRGMVDNREFPAVFSTCIESFEHIIPAISYRKRRAIAPETPKLAAFATILTYAPPLFENAAIDSLDRFVRSARVLAQHENDYLAAIEVARHCQKTAHAIWNHLERHPGALQCGLRSDIGVAQEQAVTIIEAWEKLQIIDRHPEGRSYSLSFRTQLAAEVCGVCPKCGVRGVGRKELFLKTRKCKRCGAEGHYHIEYGFNA